ncbi:MAG: SGNH/GDSL hydrolase family protein [Pyrinomonadaceae bacterium]|nr:SGNH/GDSL hydrolase family protein [Pyrinomonadaceae bacterium]
MKHVILLGDSIFDNAAYVRGGPDVINQLQGQLSDEWRATLLAVDGSVVEDVHRQLQRLPADASHLVISAGGNDAINHADILTARANGFAEALNRLADVSDSFERRYEEMLRAATSLGLPVAVSTIYYPRFPDAQLQRIAVAALSIFNDVIIRRAFMAGVPLLDLRLICNQAEDYANEIEPSVRGGEKITDVIVALLSTHDFNRRRTEVFI